jgi:hypothetical protein
VTWVYIFKTQMFSKNQELLSGAISGGRSRSEEKFIIDTIGYHGPHILSLLTLSQIWRQTPYLLAFLGGFFVNKTANEWLKELFKQPRPVTMDLGLAQSRDLVFRFRNYMGYAEPDKIYVSPAHVVRDAIRTRTIRRIRPRVPLFYQDQAIEYLAHHIHPRGRLFDGNMVVGHDNVPTVGIPGPHGCANIPGFLGRRRDFRRRVCGYIPIEPESRGPKTEAFGSTNFEGQSLAKFSEFVYGGFISKKYSVIV